MGFFGSPSLRVGSQNDVKKKNDGKNVVDKGRTAKKYNPFSFVILSLAYFDGQTKNPLNEGENIS